jgi:hypothetical protein
MCCVEIKKDIFSCFINVLIIFQTFYRDLRSRFAVGSSKINNFASPIKAYAIESFLFAPGEIILTYLSKSSTRSTALDLLRASY